MMRILLIQNLIINNLMNEMNRCNYNLSQPGEGVFLFAYRYRRWVSIFTSLFLSAGAPAHGKTKGLINLNILLKVFRNY